MPHPLASAPNVNHLWAGLLVEALVRQGTTVFVVCPGSRSTPLAVAVAQHPMAEAVVHWDERAAGFVALGWGRATGRPAAVITTSGTAVANLLPAAVEARQSGVPLLLLTADRPPELRETGANQAIRQVGVFSTVERWAFDLGPPTAAVDPMFVVTTAEQAVREAVLGGGPVHLNLPFREPLAPVPDGTDVAALVGRISTAPRGEVAWRPPAPGDLLPLLEALAFVERGLIVVGDTRRGTGGLGVALAHALGWPLLRDVLAEGGTGSPPPEEVPSADLLLTSERFRDAHAPDAVIQLGRRPTSKRLSSWLATARPALHAVIDATADRLDPDHRVSHRLVADPAAAEAVLAGALGEPRAATGWLRAWTEAGARAREAARAAVETSGLSEPAVARLLSQRLPEGSALVAAASMPVRDLEAYADRAGRSLRILANRGASGIDGTVATARGIARGLGEPVALLIGDLALLHDQTSLALLREGPPVVVVCLNNDGGGIFHRLPIAAGPGRIAPEAFERFFGTPHGLTFAHAAAQVGLAYVAPTTVAAFEAALSAALGSGASAVIEVATDRAEQAALRQRIEAAVAAAVTERP